MSDEGVLGVKSLHQPGIDPVGIDGLVIGCHSFPVLGHGRVPLSLDFQRHVLGGPTGAAPTVGNLVGQGLQRKLGISDHRLGRRVNLVNVELVNVAVDYGLTCGVWKGVAETARGKTGANRQNQIALVQIVGHLVAPDADEQGVVFGEGAFGL